jgi:hypothetical protein
LLLIFLKGTAQNGSSLFMFQKPKYWSFSKRKYNNKKDFALNNEDSYAYLGLLFNYNGIFCQGCKKLVFQAHKALFDLYRTNNNLDIPVDLQ